MTRQRLSPVQLGLWFSHHVDPARHSHNIALRVDIHGAIDPARFLAVLREVATEAETLHSRILEGEDGPWQVIDPSIECPISFLDLSGEPDPGRVAEAWMDADLNEPVDLQHGPLAAFALLKLADHRFVWYLRAHHLVVDGYGGYLVVQRQADLYTALVDGHEANNPGFGSLAAVWAEQSRYQETAAFARDRAYWLDQLRAAPGAASLATRTAPASANLLRLASEPPPTTVRHMRDTARRVRSISQLTVLAATAAYLHRVTHRGGGSDPRVLGNGTHGPAASPHAVHGRERATDPSGGPAADHRVGARPAGVRTGSSRTAAPALPVRGHAGRPRSGQRR